MNKMIAWVDLEGRYRITYPAYDWLSRAHGWSEDDALNWTWVVLVETGGYGITIDHPFHVVEEAVMMERFAECCGPHFRYGGIPRPSQDGGDGLVRDGRDGAWEMDVDGRPKVNMPKARGIQMDCIRKVRNAELAKLDMPFMRAVETGDTAEQQRIAVQKQTLRDIPQTFDLTTPNDTPEELEAMWPAELA